MYYHTAEYIDRVRRSVETGGTLDPDTPTISNSFKIARLAAGSALLLAEKGAESGMAGFGAVRPPGHHAESNRGMGFCLFNNVVLGAEHLNKIGGTVAIVDIDVHHGNGTQDAFYDRSDVLYVSSHQSPFYPGTGREKETGTGAGENYTLNVTLSAGAGWKELEPKWYGSIREKIYSFKPDFLLVSAGFDAHESDPLGDLRLTDDDFLAMAEDLSRWAGELCDGRIIGLLEGGYNLKTLERLVPLFTSELIG